MFDRRSFCPPLLAGVAALGSASLPNICSELLGQAPDKLPDRTLTLYDANEEAYWCEVRKLFLIPEDEIYLNKDIDRFLEACDEYRNTHPA